MCWFDYLSTGERQVRMFTLTNTGDVFRPGGSERPAERPRWSLAVHACENRWDSAAGTWRTAGKWTKEGTIDPGFKEPFQVVGKGEDYYFITRSGKVYMAQRPARGKGRKMVALWADARRVVAFLTDADTGRTFLFCRPAKPGERPVYWELGPRPRPLGYDPALAKPSKAPGPLRAVLHYARILVALRKVKAR
jgi:hypothetical protein